MLLGAFAVGEEAGAFERNIDLVRGVRELRGIAFGSDVDAFSIDENVVAVGFDRARELSVHAVVLEQPGVSLRIGEVVHADQLESAVRTLEDRAGDQPADAAEAVDCNSRH